MGKGIDAMTVVIETNNLGEILKVYSDLPLTVVKIDADKKGGLIEPVEPLTGMVDAKRSAVRGILDPYIHLNHIQLDRIDQVAVDTLTEEGADGGFRRGTMSTYVEKMTVAEKLACISGDDDCLTKELGFDPETGKDNEVEEYELPENLVWVPEDTKHPTWHWLRIPADVPADYSAKTRTAGMACGKKVVFQHELVASVPLGDTPSEAHTCDECQKAMQAYNIAEEAKKPCTLNWGRGRINKVWHVCMSEAKRVYPHSDDKFKKTMFHVDTACGLKEAIIIGQPTAIDCTDQPAFSPGSSSVCPECVKYRLQKTYPETK